MNRGTHTESIDYDMDASDQASGDSAPPVNADAHLIEFLQERDASCPWCGYNLRNLTGTSCPECHEHLELRVGVPHVPMLWLMLTIAPGCGGGAIAVVIIGLSLVFSALPREVVGIAVFCGLSAAASFGIGMSARNFVLMPRGQQIAWAGGSWGIHLALIILFVIGVS